MEAFRLHRDSVGVHISVQIVDCTAIREDLDKNSCIVSTIGWIEVDGRFRFDAGMQYFSGKH